MSIPVPSPSISSTTTVASPSPIAPRPVVILPGLGNNSSDYKDLTCTLSERYRIPTAVAKVSRLNWLRNAAGLVDPNYWKGTLSPRPVLDWYFERLDDAISEAKLLSQQGRMSLIGHSTGGWLARVYMQLFKSSDISLLLTLGTPHLGPPKGVPGVIDQTRGLLDYVEKNCASAVYTPEMKYVCIAGRHIQGSSLLANSSLNVINSTENNEAAELVESASYVGPTLRSHFVGQGDANPEMNINVEDLTSTIMSNETDNLTGGTSSEVSFMNCYVYQIFWGSFVVFWGNWIFWGN